MKKTIIAINNIIDSNFFLIICYNKIKFIIFMKKLKIIKKFSDFDKETLYYREILLKVEEKKIIYKKEDTERVIGILNNIINSDNYVYRHLCKISLSKIDPPIDGQAQGDKKGNLKLYLTKLVCSGKNKPDSNENKPVIEEIVLLEEEQKKIKKQPRLKY